MFEPILGVSLHNIVTEITKDGLTAIAASRIRTLEVPPRLFEGEDYRQSVDWVRGMCTEAGIRVATVHVPFGGACDISVLDETAREGAVDTLDSSTNLAIDLDAAMLIVHASAEPIASEERSRRLEQARKSLSEITSRCARLGKRVAVELLPRTCLGNSVEELLALVDGLDPEQCGVCLDTNHLMDRYETLPQGVRTLGKRLFALHLSDYDGVDEKHQLPGRGVIDWRAFVGALRDIDYQGPFNYECKLDGETVEERIRSLEANVNWLCGLL
ncbi:MAG: sugar phosphate isomerase/epimerase [Planctomycetes bacterium]|nr:sugar phosphate isomerase/epimerase [Planctomycetota bacterium]